MKSMTDSYANIITLCALCTDNPCSPFCVAPTAALRLQSQVVTEGSADNKGGSTMSLFIRNVVRRCAKNLTHRLFLSLNRHINQQHTLLFSFTIGLCVLQTLATKPQFSRSLLSHVFHIYLSISCALSRFSACPSRGIFP